MNQQTLTLFNQKTLNTLFDRLRAAKKTQILDTEILNKKPYCSPLTAIARLLATKEVCGCIHFKDGELLLSTNQDAQGGAFRKEVGKLIFQLIKGGFQDKDKLALYQRCFKDTIKAPTLSCSPKLYSKIKLYRDYIIDKGDWSDISLKEIAALMQNIENFIENNKTEQNLVRSCIPIYIALSDIDSICNELAKQDYQYILSLCTEKSFTHRYGSVSNLHCEMAAIQRDSQTIGLEKLAIEMSERVKTKEFTISKFCCYLCYLVFDSLKDCSNQKKCLDFSYLGNSSRAYMAYQSPRVPRNEFSEKVAHTLNSKIEYLIKKIDQKDYKELQGRCFIENHEVIKKLDCYCEENSPAYTKASNAFSKPAP